jgi:hypothetical protein
MLSSDLINELHELDRSDKLQVMQFLVSELAQNEGALINNGIAYPVWSPHHANEAGDKMLRVLKEEASDYHE